MALKILPSAPREAKILTQIAFAAKRTWNYPEHYYTHWNDELTITPDYIEKNTVYSAYWMPTQAPAGFYSIVVNPIDVYVGDVFVEKGTWLEHLFILPEFQEKGIGKKMITHCLECTKEKGIKSIYVFVDPFARGFYEKTGAIFCRNSKSSIPSREIPVFAYYL